MVAPWARAGYSGVSVAAILSTFDTRKTRPYRLPVLLTMSTPASRLVGCSTARDDSVMMTRPAEPERPTDRAMSRCSSLLPRPYVAMQPPSTGSGWACENRRAREVNQQRRWSIGHAFSLFLLLLPPLTLLHCLVVKDFPHVGNHCGCSSFAISARFPAGQVFPYIAGVQAGIEMSCMMKDCTCAPRRK
jgi:hypothetical protein